MHYITQWWNTEFAETKTVHDSRYYNLQIENRPRLFLCQTQATLSSRHQQVYRRRYGSRSLSKPKLHLKNKQKTRRWLVTISCQPDGRPPQPVRSWKSGRVHLAEGSNVVNITLCRTRSMSNATFSFFWSRHENLMILHWDMAIYRFLKWRQSAILELFYHHTRPPTKSLSNFMSIWYTDLKI